MADAQQLLAEALAMLDTASTLEHYELHKALEPAGKAAKESGEKVDELRFEFTAVYLALYDEPNVWGTFYGPEMSSIDNEGNRFDTPPFESITPECIAYWIARMNSARHPALRARYGDMVWDLSQQATGTKPTIDTALAAIDGYSEALTAYPETSSHSWGDIRKRIIDLALSINDQHRLRKAIAANAAYPPEGAKAIIVDDLIASGETIFSSVDVLRDECDTEVVGVVSIVNWGFAEPMPRFRNAEIPATALTSWPNLLASAHRNGLLSRRAVDELARFYQNPKSHEWDLGAFE